MMNVHFGKGAPNVYLANELEPSPANRTRRIICTNELWVPSARIGGCYPGGVALGRCLKGGVGSY